MNGADLWTIDDIEEPISGCDEEQCSITDAKRSEIKRQSDLLRTQLHTTPITYDYSLLSSKFVDGSSELYRQNSTNLEYHLVKYNTYRGVRHSTYQAYLKPAFDRPNLKIVLSTRVHRILFKQRNAIGVLATADSLNQPPHKIHAAREVILSAGAFHTPQILKLSGVGPVKELKRYDIGVVHNSQMVGRNLYDHLSMPIYVSVNESMSVTRSKVLNVLEIFGYLLHGGGIFSNFGVIGYLTDPENDHGTGIFGVGTIDERLLRKIVNYDGDVCFDTFILCLVILCYQNNNLILFDCRYFARISHFTMTVNRKDLYCSIRVTSH